MGANDPTLDSVTRYFYDRGWRGINVEPTSEYYARQCAERPRDLNLNIGLSNHPGTAKLYEARGLSTFSAAQMAWHRERGVEFTEREVALRTLAEICAEHEVDRIDFLSIDVEGYEQHVIEGADFTRWRPLVIVVESTLPNTREPSHHAWEPLLLAADYQFAAFDGLNRFYVRAEDAERGRCLEVGANMFDNFVPNRWAAELAHTRRLVEKWRARAERRLSRRIARAWSRVRGGIGS